MCSSPSKCLPTILGSPFPLPFSTRQCCVRTVWNSMIIFPRSPDLNIIPLLAEFNHLCPFCFDQRLCTSPGYRITAATCDLPFGAFCCCSRLPAQINLGSSKIQSLPNWSPQNALLLLDSYPRSDIKDEILTVMHWSENSVCWCVGPKMINSLNPCCLRFLSHCCPQKTVLMGTFKFPGSILLSCILSLKK